MNMTHTLAIAGGFPAVKCDDCDTISSALDGDYLAFSGSASVGLTDVVLGVDSPCKLAKKRAS